MTKQLASNQSMVALFTPRNLLSHDLQIEEEAVLAYYASFHLNPDDQLYRVSQIAPLIKLLQDSSLYRLDPQVIQK